MRHSRSGILLIATLVSITVLLASCTQTETSQSELERGIANKLVGNHEEAYFDFTRAIELDSTNALAYLERAKNKCNTPQREDPVADLSKYAELTAPSLSLAYVGISLGTADHEMALAVLDKAILINPTDMWSYFYKDMKLKMLGDPKRLAEFRAGLTEEMSERIRKLKEERGIKD